MAMSTCSSAATQMALVEHREKTRAGYDMRLGGGKLHIIVERSHKKELEEWENQKRKVLKKGH